MSFEAATTSVSDTAAGPPAPPATGPRWWIGLVLGPALYVLPQLVAPLPDVTPLGMRTLGTFMLMVTWWICETVPIPVTALLGMALLAIGGIMPVQQAFGFWANWINLFLIGAFIIGHASTVHGLNRRFAYYVLSIRMLSGRPWALLAAFWIATAAMSTISSNVVTTLVFMSIGIGLLETLKVPREHPVGGVLMLGVGWAAGIGGIGTPVGTPPNMITIGFLDQAGYHVGFLQWSVVGMAIAAVGMAALFVTMRWVARPDVSCLNVPYQVIRQELDRLGPVRRAEWLSAAALGVALLLWLLPDFSLMTLGEANPITRWLQQRLSWPVTAIIVAATLFAIPLDRSKGQFLMHWGEAVKGIEWGTLALIAGALAVGDAVGSPTVGLGSFLSKQVAAVVDPSAPWYFFVGGCVGFTVLLTNFMSNNATVSMVLPLAIGVASAPASSVDPSALAVAIGIGTSMAFALPAATPPVAIVYASGRVRITDMVRYGAVLALLCTAITILLGYPLALKVLNGL